MNKRACRWAKPRLTSSFTGCFRTDVYLGTVSRLSYPQVVHWSGNCDP